MISTLKNRDTSSRDIARECLAKMITTMGLVALKAVLYELQYMLKEGMHCMNYLSLDMLSWNAELCVNVCVSVICGMLVDR